ncbi:MAG: FecR family protein [Treponema sp.]|nr:FecR family protein [Treponema sp.]
MKKKFFMKKTLLMFILIMFIGLSLSAQEARFVRITGTVEVKTKDSQIWQPAFVDGIINKNMLVSTGVKSSAEIFVGGSKITLSPLTVLTLEELVQQGNTETSSVYLRSGRVKADVTPPSGAKAEFVVRSPTTTASVRGTSFSYNGRQLSVYEGKVALANQNGQKVYVNKNQRSYVDKGKNQRLALPFETVTEIIRPRVSDLDRTGSGKEKQKIPSASSTGTVDITMDW